MPYNFYFEKPQKDLRLAVKVNAEDPVRFWCPRLHRAISPEEIASEILKKIARYASDFIGEKVTNVVITVPIYFGKAQCRATRKAGNLAGLKVINLLRVKADP